MKKEIVYTDKYALILSDDEIKVGNWYLRYQQIMRCAKLELNFNEAINKEETIIVSDSCGDPYERSIEHLKLIIAHLPLSDAPILEGVPLLPSFSWGQQNDVEELAKEWNNKGEFTSAYSFKAGYNKAKENYKYTEDDVLLAIEVGFNIGKNFDDDNPNIGLGWLIHQKDNFIKSLQQTSRPTHFECGMLCGRCRTFDDECWSAKECTRGYDYPDIIITTTNSQGQLELVGKYLNL